LYIFTLICYLHIYWMRRTAAVHSIIKYSI